MLVLTRKAGQSIYLGDDIKLFVQEVRGNQVRIGIEAPGDVRVYREEIYLQILDESRKALEQTLAQSLSGSGELGRADDIEGTLARFSTSLSSSSVQINGGMIGFSKWEHFNMIPANIPFYWLSCKDKSELKFLTLPVTKFKNLLFPNANLSNKAEVFCLVIPHQNFLESTINLRAPLIVNSLNNSAIQLVIDDDSYAVRMSLAELLAKL